MIRALIRFAVFVLVVGAIVLVGSRLFLAPGYTIATDVLDLLQGLADKGYIKG